jgi:hypothetical protein
MKIDTIDGGFKVGIDEGTLLVIEIDGEETFEIAYGTMAWDKHLSVRSSLQDSFGRWATIFDLDYGDDKDKDDSVDIGDVKQEHLFIPESDYTQFLPDRSDPLFHQKVRILEPPVRGPTGIRCPKPFPFLRTKHVDSIEYLKGYNYCYSCDERWIWFD